MDPITCFLSSGLLIIGLVYLVKRAVKRFRFIALVDAIPGPRAYPVIGNVLDTLVPRNQLMKAFSKRVEMNPPLFRIWIGPIGEVHLTRPEHIEVVLNSMKHLEKSYMYKMLQPWLGQGLLTSKGSKWHSHRKMITPTFHFKILDIFVDIFVDKSEILVKKIQSQVGGKGFNIYPYITLCALDIICETAMGIQMNAQDNSKSDYVTAVYDISELTMQRGLRPWLHANMIFNRTSMGKKYNKSIAILHDFTNKVIHERRILREENQEDLNVNSDDEDLFMGKKKKKLAFLDLLLEASVKDNKLTDVEIREEVDTFMFEGHDTTTAGISWAIFLLGSHSDVQDKAFEELDEIFQGSDRSITMRDLQQMKYLERVIKETLRLYPSVPFIGRTINEDLHIGEYLVPAGCKVNLHIYHCHRNADQFPDPEKFNPDHFLPENVQARHPYAYIPFSAGPRNCIGQKFALLEEKTILASILRKYKIESLEKREDLTLMSELILRPESGINVILTPRQ